MKTLSINDAIVVIVYELHNILCDANAVFDSINKKCEDIIVAKTDILNNVKTDSLFYAEGAFFRDLLKKYSRILEVYEELLANAKESKSNDMSEHDYNVLMESKTIFDTYYVHLKDKVKKIFEDLKN